MVSALVVTSSATLFIPAIVSVFTQSLLVSIVLLGSALFSTLYHAYDEERYETMDLIWASLAVIIAIIMLAVLALRYSVYNWRVLLPVALGFSALMIYFFRGSSDETDIDSDDYDLWHSLWHFVVTLAGLALVITPVDLRDAVPKSYEDVGLSLWRHASKKHT